LPQILPEIRLGGEYQLYNDWFITAAWMHAFGGTLGVNIQDVTVSSTFTSFGNILFNLNNPTMNTVAFGLEYRFN
jgi:hypothetical protein